MARELQYQGLAELNVLVNDTSKYSSEYFQVTNFPSVFTAGKNLFRFKGIADKFIEESDILIEVLDSNGQPIYYEADLNLESGEQSIIVAVYVDEETPPGQGEIILCGYLSNVISEEEGPTVRWRQSIDIDPTKQNDAEIIFNVIPAATVSTSSVVDSYTVTNYANAALVKSASINNFTYDYRNNGNPVIIGTVNTTAIASLNKSGSARFEVSRSRFTGNPSSTFTLTATTLSSSVASYISTGSNIIFTLSDPFESGIQGSNQVHTFINGTGTTGSLYFDQTGSTSSSENTYTIISASFANLQPQVGNIAKIRTFYKSVGVGEYVLASETDILDLATEFGYTPESASIIVPLPTVHRNDRFDLKFQFLNSAEAVSKQVLYVKDVGMPGGNVYIGGDDNLITGSVYVAGQTGAGVSIEGSNAGAFIRSVGYEGFQNVVANGATGQPGFIMYSGSVATMLNSTQTENYRGIGLELTAHSESYLRYTTSGSGLLDIRTNKFFLGSSQQYIVGADGLIQISSSNFFLSSSGDVIMAGTITATAGNIGGFTITSHSLSGNNFFISGAATSTGFFISASKFNVKGNGDVTGSNVLFTGGKIAGWTIDSDKLSSGNVTLNATNQQIFLGDTTYEAAEIAFTGSGIGKFGSININGVAGALNGGSAFLDTFNGTELDSTLWYNNSNNAGAKARIVSGALRLENNDAQWDYAIVGKKAFQRANSSVVEFHTKVLTITPGGTGNLAAPRMMMGFTDKTGSTVYSDNVHAFYFSTGSLQIYEGSTSRATLDSNVAVGDTYKLIMKPQSSGIQYEVYKNEDYTTVYKTGSVGSSTNASLYPAIWTYPTSSTMEFYSVAAYDSTTPGAFDLKGGGSFGLIDNSGSHLTFTRGGFSLSSPNVDITGRSIRIGDAFKFDGSNLTVSGSSARILTPSFFLGSSTQYVSGSNGNIAISSSNFFLDTAGNVTMAGTIRASAGTIGGFNISSNALSSNNFFISGAATGNEFFISASNFNVKANGNVTGSQVLFTGGKIGSFALSTNALSGINSSTGATTFFISSSVDTTSPDGVAYFISSSKFNVRQDGTISGSQVLFDGGKVGGFTIDSSKITGTNIIIDSAGSLQTADYASDLKGWKISAVDNGYAEFENVKVRGTLKTAVFEKETVNAVGGQLYVANSSTISGSEASSSIPQLAYLKFGGYSGSNAIQNIAGSSNTYLTLDLTSASIANLPTSTQTFKPLGGTGLLVVSGSKTVASTTNTNIATMPGITTPASASLTIMAWVRPDFSSYTSTLPSGSIIEKSGSNSSLTGPFFIGFRVASSTTGSLILASGNNTSGIGGYTAGTNVLRNNTWTHIAMTVAPVGSNYARTIYVNGVLDGGTNNTTVFSDVNTSPINIGVGRTYTERFPGYITDFRLYTSSLSAAQIAVIYSGSYVTASIDASTTALQIDNVTGFVNGEILSAKKVSNTGFATEYFQVRDTMRLNPSSDTDFSGMLYVTRSYGNGLSGNSGSLGNSPSTAQSYEPSQVIVSTGKLGTGFIRINANPNDQATPYIDIVERTGSGIYDVALKARLGDLSGLANSSYVFGNSNPGFGLATDNVFLQGGIIANTGSIGGINMQSSKLFTGTGTFNDNNTGFYLDSTSQFSLGNKLSWNGTSLNIVGDITVTNTDDFASLRDKSTYVTALISSGSVSYTSFATDTNRILTRSGFSGAISSSVTSSNALADISASYDLYIFDHAFVGANTKAQLILDLFDAGYSVFSSGNDTTVSNTTGSAGSEWPIIAAVSKTGGNFTSSSLATGIGGISPNDPISFGWASFYTGSESDTGVLPTKLKTNMNGASTCIPLAVSGSTQADAVPDSNTTAAYVAFYATNPRGGRWVHTNARLLNGGLNPSASIKLLDFLYRRDNAQEAYHNGFTKITGNMIQTGKIQSTNWTTGGSVGSEFNLNNGTFKLGGDVNPEFSWDGTNLRVSGSSTELLTPSFLLGGSSQYISGSGGNIRISSSNFHLDTAGNVTMAGTVSATAGNIGGFNITANAITGSGFYLSGSATSTGFFISSSKFNIKGNGDVTGSNVLFTGGTVGGFTLSADKLSGTNFNVSSSGVLTLGSATSFTAGDGIYLSNASTNNFRVGDQNAARLQFDGTNLEIYNSSNTKLVSIGATNTIAGFTLSDSTLSNGSNFFISGSATGNQFFISASNFNVKANGAVTASGLQIKSAEPSTLGYVVYDSSIGYLDAYNIGRQVAQSETSFFGGNTNTAGSTSPTNLGYANFTTVQQGIFYILPGETAVYFVAGGLVDVATNLTTGSFNVKMTLTTAPYYSTDTSLSTIGTASFAEGPIIRRRNGAKSTTLRRDGKSQIIDVSGWGGSLVRWTLQYGFWESSNASWEFGPYVIMSQREFSTAYNTNNPGTDV